MASTRFSTASISLRNASASSVFGSRPGDAPNSLASFSFSRSVVRSCSSPRRVHSDSSISATFSLSASRICSANRTCAAMSASVPSLFGSRRTSSVWRSVSRPHCIATVYVPGAANGPTWPPTRSRSHGTSGRESRTRTVLFPGGAVRSLARRGPSCRRSQSARLRPRLGGAAANLRMRVPLASYTWKRTESRNAESAVAVAMV